MTVVTNGQISKKKNPMRLKRRLKYKREKVSLRIILNLHGEMTNIGEKNRRSPLRCKEDKQQWGEGLGWVSFEETYSFHRYSSRRSLASRNKLESKTGKRLLPWN